MCFLVSPKSECLQNATDDTEMIRKTKESDRLLDACSLGEKDSMILNSMGISSVLMDVKPCVPQRMMSEKTEVFSVRRMASQREGARAE